MNIYENNKQLLTTMGGDSANLATDYEVRKAILDLLGGDSSNCNSIYEVDKQILNIYLEGGGGTGGEIPLIPITITDNGVYVPEEGGYSEVIVDIPFGELVVSANGEYLPENGVKAYNKVTVNVESEVKRAKVLTLDINDSCIVDGTWGAESIDTSLMTNMNYIFSGISSLQSLDVSGWNTSNVTSMYQMFLECSSLQSLDVSGWNTSNVTNMNEIFGDCSSLQSLDVSGWNTSNVTNMDYMFSSCSSLQSLDVSGWNTSNVTSMYQMFCKCYSLQTLDLSNFDTSNVTDIIRMTQKCGSNNGTFNAVGGRTIDEVISGNIGILNGLNINISSSAISEYSDRATLRALINGVADRTGQSSLSMSLGSTQTAKLTEEDIAVATAKNWTIS